MADGGVRCRVEGCKYSYKPRLGSKLAELLGCRPGDVDLSAFRFGKGVTYGAGDTLNIVSCYRGAVLGQARQAMAKHHQCTHKELPLPDMLKGRPFVNVQGVREVSVTLKRAMCNYAISY